MIVECSNLKCKYRNDKGYCNAKVLTLELNGINTKYQGFQDYLKCKSFEIDEEYKKLQKKVKALFSGIDKE